MKRQLIVLAVGALLVPQLVLAGPYDQPYGLIESGDASQTRNHAPVAISRIDGQTTRNARRPDPVAPGKHTVDISFSSARAVVGDQDKTIEIDVQPCKRYRVVAKYHTAASGKWDPVIAVTEDIGECKRKFMQGEPAKK